MTFEAARQALQARSPAVIEWSLRPTQFILERLGHPEKHFAAVHVAGTNGKGSVCHLVYAALRGAGHRVGLYTSPHLVDVRERIMVDDRPVSVDAFARWAEVIAPALEETGASFFEATTALAFADFAARGVDIAVVEVGLGGRLDATNVIDPLVAVITQIALDHTDYLGDSLEGIAREKAGIAKPGRPLVIGETAPDLVSVIEAVGRAQQAQPVVVPAGERYDGPLGLRGPHQRRNAAIGRRVLHLLPPAFQPSDEVIRRAFAETHIPGRFDVRGKWIFDVAHNPQGLEALAATLDEFHPPRPLKALVGILKDKDWPAMLARLGHLVDEVWVTDPPSAPADRRWDLDLVQRTMPMGLVFERDFERAMRDVQASAATVLVTGSFHTVGDALARLPGFAPLG